MVLHLHSTTYKAKRDSFMCSFNNLLWNLLEKQPLWKRKTHLCLDWNQFELLKRNYYQNYENPFTEPFHWQYVCCKSGWTIIQLIHLVIWYFGLPIASFWVLGFYILSIVSKIKNRLPIISTADTLDTQCIFAVSVSIVAYVFSNAIIDIPIFLYTPIYLGRVHILRHSWSTMHHI